MLNVFTPGPIQQACSLSTDPVNVLSLASPSPPPTSTLKLLETSLSEATSTWPDSSSPVSTLHPGTALAQPWHRKAVAPSTGADCLLQKTKGLQEVRHVFPLPAGREDTSVVTASVLRVLSGCMLL